MKRTLSVISCLLLISSLPGLGQDAALSSQAPAEVSTETEATSSAADNQETQPEPVEPQLTEQDVLKEMTGQLSKLVSMLSKVRDEASANSSADEIAVMMEKLFAVDYAAYEGVDEEEVAAGLTDLFNDLELQVTRLYEFDFFGNTTLKKTFGAEEEPFTPPPGKDDESVEGESSAEDAEEEPLNEPD